MAVTSTNRRAGPFLGDGAATVFPFSFKVFGVGDLYVILEDTGGDTSTLVYGTDYTASLNANQDVSPGGSVTLSAALTIGYRLIITSAIAELQQIVLTNLGGFFPDVINGALDRLTILIQQLQSGVDQSLKLSILDDLSGSTLPPAAARANTFLYFGADGTPGVVSNAPIQGNAANFAGPLIGVQNSTNKIFTITNNGTPIGSTPVQAIVWKNFPLIPGAASGTGYSLGPIPGQVTFAVAPDPGDDLYASGVFTL